MFLLIVGPDGAGKSLLAGKLVESLHGRFTGVLRLHWRPGLLPRAGAVIGVRQGDPSRPHGRDPHGAVLSLALLLYHWLDFFIGSWIRIVPFVKKGGLVVMERGWLDIAVDPRRYRLSVSSRLVEALGMLLPKPDVAIILETSPGILNRRKAELALDELERQVDRWRSIAFPRGSVRRILDASRTPEELVYLAMKNLVN